MHVYTCLWIDDRLNSDAVVAQWHLASISQEREVRRHIRVGHRVQEVIIVPEDVVDRCIGALREGLLDVGDEVGERRRTARKDQLVEVDDDEMAEAVHVAVHTIVDYWRPVKQVLCIDRIVVIVKRSC